MSPPRAILSAAPAALAAFALAAAAAVPAEVYAARPANLAWAPALAVAYGAAVLWPALAFALGAAAIAAWRGEVARARVVPAAAARLAVSGGACAWLGRLAAEDGLAGRSPLVLAALPALAVFLAWSVGTVGEAAPARRLVRAVRRAAPLAAIGGAAAAYAAAAFALRDAYPGLHAAAVLAAFLLLLVALAHAAARWPRAAGRVAAVSLALAVAGAAAAASGAAAPARPHVLHDTAVGHAAVAAGLGARASGAPAAAAAPDPDGERRFREHAHLPDLPRGFALGNVLLVVSEALRHDQTSLADPSLGTTPRLARLAREGALWFTRAYAPSSGTMQSMAALMAMSYPSAAPIDIGRPAWRGTLREEADTVAEALAGAGWHTFWAGHDHKRCFTRWMHGLGQGFAERALVPVGPETADGDRRIADAAIAAIDAAAARGRPWFGWVFLVSPHDSYLAHDRARPARRPLDRYRQELAAMDGQLGRLLDHLARAGLDRRTAVIVTGDHGEEFREHGKTGHSKQVYVESVRVPLLVRVPGLSGRRIDEPTSTLYVLPWLLLSGPPGARAAARARLRAEIGPMLRETDGAVVSQLVTTRFSRAALSWRDYRVVHDSGSDLTELFSPRRDPGDRHDLAGAHPAVAARHRALLSRYRAVAEATRRIRLPGPDGTVAPGPPL